MVIQSLSYSECRSNKPNDKCDNMPVEKRFTNESPLKDYTHMRTLALRLNTILPEYEFIPLLNGYEIGTYTP